MLQLKKLRNNQAHINFKLDVFSSHVPSFISVFHRNSNDTKDGIRKYSATSNVSNNTTNSVISSSLPVQEIFRRSGHWSHRGDVAGGDSGNILELKLNH